MERGSCERCEEEDAVLRDPYGDEVCVTCYNISVGAIKKEEEELRTCYVGVTRAQKELYILNTGRQKHKFPHLIL